MKPGKSTVSAPRETDSLIKAGHRISSSSSSSALEASQQQDANMEEWKRICILLCLVGFFKSLRPSEPFLTNFLMEQQYYNLTYDVLTAQVFPIATYSYLCVLVVVLLITDYVRYKPMIVLEATTIAGTYFLLIFGRTLLAVQFVEFLYAVGTASEVAYYTYIYAKVSQSEYQKVTSFTRVAVLSGFFSSGVIAQVLVTTKLFDSYMELNYITVTCAGVASILAILLPPAKQSIYFHREELGLTQPPTSKTVPPQDDGEANHAQPSKNGGFGHSGDAETLPRNDSITVSEVRYVTGKSVKRTLMRNLKVGFWTIQRDFKESYRNSSVFKWSLWFAFGTCLNLQVGNYIQPLWETIRNSEEENIYNGAVESASTLLGALSALAVGYIHLDWSKYGEAVLMSVSMLDGACLFIMAYTSNIWIAYTTYTLFRASYQMAITIASYQVAKDIRADSYGLIFGCNTFVALAIQTILTFIVPDEHGLKLPPRAQFAVYASYSVILGGVFLVTSILTLCKGRSAYNMGRNQKI